MIAHQLQNIHDVLGRHPVHPFPARMAPGIALSVIKRVPIGGRVLDPMMGSGTVLAVARNQGCRTVGFDLDPLAVLTARVWTSVVEAARAQAYARRVLSRAESLFTSISARSAYPHGADEETKAFLRYWFDANARKQLYCLATAIRRIHDKSMRDALWCAFSRLIISKQAGASRAMDLAHSRPHRSFEVAPTKPFEKFIAAVDRVVENCIPKNSKDRGPKPRIMQGDARDMPVPDATVDLVLSSPPYLNAIDYIRCSKFTLVWMGYSIRSLREIRSNSVGTEVGMNSFEDREVANIVKELGLKGKLSKRDRAVLHRYVADIRASLREAARVLVPGGRAVYVVGENTVKGTYIPNSEIVRATARLAGLRLRRKVERVLPPNRRYLPPPSALKNGEQIDKRMAKEVILYLQKPDLRATAASGRLTR